MLYIAKCPLRIGLVGGSTDLADNISWVALTGKNHDNKLHTKSFHNRKLNVWVDSQDYGVVECTHQVLLHSIMEVMQ